MPRPRHELVWSPTAERDLADIWRYLNQNASIEVAETQIRKIVARCEALRLNPRTGRMRNDLRPGLRQVLANPYNILYRVTEAQIEIMRALHGRRDFPALFVDEE
jgi:toxin ParE1/3/4